MRLAIRRSAIRLTCMAAAMVAMASTAHANGFDPEGRYNGGAPINNMFGMFGGGYSSGGGYGGGGGSPVGRAVVNYPTNERPGTIIVNTNERRLYLIQGNGTALRYGIGVGREGFTWRGVKTVSAKKEWPSWTPPAQMLQRRPDLPRFMRGGPDNPLGARAMYLGSTLYRIHGSNEPETIGQAVSSGCFRMTNSDVIDLYNRVRVGAKVIVR